MKAIVLLSGGLDSTTTLATAINQGFDEIYALTFRYGQRHEYEIECAKRIANHYKPKVKEHVIADINLRMFGGSALTSDIEVPKNRPLEEMSIGIPVTYVPARNTIFLSFALAWSDVIGSSDIYIGVNALDYSGYPDCRPEYIKAYTEMAHLATKAGVEGIGCPLEIHAPLISLSKTEIIRNGMALGVDYAMTSTCYEPVAGMACGVCDACLLRLKGFKELGQKDPIAYRKQAAA